MSDELLDEWHPVCSVCSRIDYSVTVTEEPNGSYRCNSCERVRNDVLPAEYHDEDDQPCPEHQMRIDWFDHNYDVQIGPAYSGESIYRTDLRTMETELEPLFRAWDLDGNTWDNVSVVNTYCSNCEAGGTVMVIN